MRSPLIPLDVLFGNPTKATPRLSPDGTRLAWIAPRDGVLNIWVGQVDGSDPKPVTNDRERGIRSYLWTHDGTAVLYVQDVGGDENWRLYRVALDSLTVTDLTPFENVQVQILAYEKTRPHEIVIALNKDDVAAHDAYHLDLRTGALTLLAKNPGHILGWTAGKDLNIRAAVAATPEGGSELLVRDSPASGWRLVNYWTGDDSLTSGPVAFDADGTSLLLIDSQDANAGRLVRVDLATNQRTIFAEDDRFDVSDVMLHPDTRAVQAVAFNRARTEWQILDASIAAEWKAITQLVHGDFDVSHRTHDDRQWIVGVTQDTGGVSWYRWDRNARAGTHVFDARPDLAKYTLAPMEPIGFTSRDGLPVEGYLTVPPGVARSRLPVVLNVHGGPWHRDEWGYDPESQWLANRGYAVLQVNYRGSTGYGKAFLNAGNREWGGRMHDDLVDAVEWAVNQGIADPERVAIYGGSYGGYAALVGATFTPDLFRCAVAIVGPSNLITFINTIPPYWSSYLAIMHERVGNPKTEAAFLRSRSPLTYVDRIRIPMLVAQGANDPRVKQSESEQIVAAMAARGIPHEYMLFPDEGHGFAKPENRLKFYGVAEQFLAEHLGERP
ncbi:MAG: S9 family peptidase [Gemmatimonadales bacterium]